ncbi:DinB family protein [Streptomyces sp. TRM 70351]|uniref:DinB family protein n=1 Tax=Streptomyces sp. TRM 70351 TaxID=3116552 RepID=UPI002E7BFA24|nr:DinB family protein [Streptomyces sp. TRM 70351]MEE1930219.1 DinB family protein [Streptomyces sp. TRM 70351]
MTDLPVPARVTTAGEREVLEAFLDFHRDIVRAKLAGVLDEAARSRLVPSSTTLSGIVKHLTAVEGIWFRHVLLGEGPPPPPTQEAHWEIGPGETPEVLIAAYDAACELSRRSAADLPLDHTGRHALLGEVSLRWIYGHMIGETARHAGHADILREQTDGRTGILG